MSPGDTLFLFTDGLSESRDAAGEEYGTSRLLSLLCRHKELLPADLIRVCLGDLSSFCAATPKHDDLTVMALRRSN
jgi:sigma-B regulation protein RsbU (phosphoserine phosphatase)